MRDGVNMWRLGVERIFRRVVFDAKVLSIQRQPTERVDAHHDATARGVDLTVLKAVAQIFKDAALVQRGQIDHISDMGPRHALSRERDEQTTAQRDHCFCRAYGARSRRQARRIEL